MNGRPDITVIIATFNNSSELRRTLEGFSRAGSGEVQVEFGIVDNNSRDRTRAVVDEFAKRLRIEYIHEPRQGKCVALNRALNSLRLGNLVFFTDDDVDVPANLFRQAMECAERNRSCSVFGGEVYLVWPPGPVPDWAKALADSYRGYSHMNLGPDERPFPPLVAPMGTNWWVRREVLEKGYRFDERIGPGAARCSMGDETAFLLKLVRDGFRMIYAPSVRIGHRVPSRLLDERAIVRRGLAAGRAGALLAYEYGFGPKRRVVGSMAWGALRVACLVRWGLSYATAFWANGRARRVCRRWDSMQGIGWNLEAVRIAFGTEGHSPSQHARMPGT